MVAEAPGPRATVLVDSAERGAWTLTCIVRGKGRVFRSAMRLSGASCVIPELTTVSSRYSSAYICEQLFHEAGLRTLVEPPISVFFVFGSGTMESAFA